MTVPKPLTSHPMEEYGAVPGGAHEGTQMRSSAAEGDAHTASLRSPEPAGAFSRQARLRLGAAGLVLGGWAFVVNALGGVGGALPGAGEVSALDASLDGSGELRFVVGNAYTSRDGQPSWDYPWLSADDAVLVSPHQETFFSVVEPSEHAVYAWRLQDTFTAPPPPPSIYNGTNVQSLMVRDVSDLELTLTEYNKLTGDVLRTATRKVHCRYVRREIRALNEHDRESFFETARVLWDTPTAEGIAHFGEGYRSVEYFIDIHNQLAGALDCDHMHDGLGFLTQHLGLSLRFEQALQAVNPAVSLPYWDYTIDSAHVQAENGGDFETYLFTSELWQPNWFGTADPDLHYVTEGRWAYTKVSTDWNSTHSAYGYLRAPWNANPVEYVTRVHSQCGQAAYDFQGWPDCASHYGLLNNFTDFLSFGYSIQVLPHGPVHVNIGGTFGCEDDYDRLSHMFQRSQLAELKVLSFATVKNMYRLGLRICPDFCSTDTDPSECKCGCPDLSSYTANVTVLKETLLNTKVIPSPQLIDAIMAITERDEDGVEKANLVADVLCNANVYVGDQLESGSPADISFWPIHPTIERLWMWKKLRHGFTDEKWVDSTTNSIFGDSCTGHAEEDMIAYPFKLWDEPTRATLYSNAELYTIADPSTSRLPYVYDTFKWVSSGACGDPQNHQTRANLHQHIASFSPPHTTTHLTY